jgi:PAS domain S-box-containing protein
LWLSFFGRKATLVWTDNVHHLIWKDIWLNAASSPPIDVVTHNVWFWIYTVYAYSLLLIGTLSLLRLFKQSQGIYQKQAGILLLAALIPWVANFLFISGFGQLSAVDPTPLAFAITGLGFYWGLSRLQLLNIMPIAHDAVLRSMSDGVIVLDTQQHIVELNPSAQKIIEHDRSEVIGHLYNKVLPGQLGLLDLNSDMTETEAVIVLGEGLKQRYYEISVTPISTQQHFIGHLVILHDDTERVKSEVKARERVVLETELIERKKAEEILKVSEAKFRNLVENAAAGILVTLFGGRVLSANKAALDIYGYSSEEELKNTSVQDRYANLEDRVRLLHMIQAKGIVKGFEVLMKHKNSTQFWASINLIIQTTESGEKQFISIFEDITDRKNAEVELARLNEELRTFNLQLEIKVEERTRQLEEAVTEARASNQAKSEFLANMSHELRTPLNAVIGFSQVLQAKYFGDLNEKQSEYVKDILDSGKHLLSLINDILDLSKIEAGKMELEISSIRIADLLRNSLVMVKEKSQSHNISLEVKIDEDIENLEISGDERKLKQVMFNLLSNATKFTPDRGSITVEARKENGELLVCVSDTGIGISAQEKRRLFEAFYQASGGIKDKTPGTGLGLKITKSILEKHGGGIWVESEGPGKGSCFSFTLPIKVTIEV